MNPLYRTIRLIYRASKTEVGQNFLAFIGIVLFALAMWTILTLSCVGLHGYDGCF